jgi:hypothetical protein
MLEMKNPATKSTFVGWRSAAHEETESGLDLEAATVMTTCMVHRSDISSPSAGAERFYVRSFEKKGGERQLDPEEARPSTGRHGG